MRVHHHSHARCGIQPRARINAGDGEQSAPGSRRVPFKTSPAFSLSSSRGSRAHRQSRDDAGGWRQKPAGGSFSRDRVGVPRLGAMTATQRLTTAASLFETGPARESGASFGAPGGAG
ncbi:hypothetical protein FRZ44_38280 [Hypericibacter terrae]|uniref:Uncharacterized protein n=1 Tax=Hypericibacter terrae TaxID=2602015 RepID=A0A5J6MMV2_9PROT|nr:hypothetical protein FRZ44_38280 [Hypericibacter terrae]